MSKVEKPPSQFNGNSDQTEEDLQTKKEVRLKQLR